MKLLRLMSLGALAVLGAGPAAAYAPAALPERAERAQERLRVCMGAIEAGGAERRAACDESLTGEFNRAVRADLLASRGWISEAENALNEALRDFDAALKAVPNHLAALRGRAHTLSELGRHAEAAALIERAMVLGGRATLLADRALLRERAGNIAGARADLDDAIALDPSNSWARGTRGRFRQDEGEHEAAVADFDAALALEPEVTSYHYRRGLSLVALARPREAIAAFDAALRLEPTVVQVWLERGRAFEMLGHDGPALASYERALRLDSRHEASLSRRAFLLQRMGRVEDAIAAYDRLLTVQPQAAFGLNNRAGLLAGLGRGEEALGDLDRAIALVPDDRNALRNRAQLLLTLGRNDKALRDLDRAGPGHDAGAWHGMRGDALLALGRPQPALGAYRAALALKPQDHATLFGFGLAQEIRGDRSAAAAAYGALLAVDPEHEGALERREELLPALGRSIEVWPARLAGLWRSASDSYVRERAALQGVYRALQPQAAPAPLPVPPNPLAALDAALALDAFDVPRLIRRAQFSIGQPQREAQARADLAVALLLEPENPAALVQRARLNFRDGAFIAAQADADAALRSEPRSIEALFQRARALTARGQLGAALKAYDDVVAVAPANAAALLNRALLLQRAREYERALADLDAAVAADRADPDGWVARAALRTALGQTDAAIADFDRALSLDARLGQAWYGRALAHQRRGDAAEAAADFARAKALDAQAEERYRAFGVAP
ncbi:Tfp pilus assembly protein PilF [Bosea sp. 62]|uniref:tetratricopeptide repeat protein n=1 Tax=unclassified Bosea (in: a-proteobacteria) TaxID=2653178 RepID=UPI00125AE59E|nr:MULTISPECIES: tetratricopeptide repeat protein [unclassified Bosea (in: a-proteobacteria)]CAD5246243.1 Tfp pilus assembly protein PilF [Bosea sp. 21B]CAD5247634.1 Tfp pilus assembly protein PilF [Bosea sp. 7B]CAD5268852.1 Tfp pilus assembly protein PilF [Bosea sp. 46]VVT50529.1 Tfp pilus assembly protein PilF [Bosea sp. EC-HK365B]VXB00104.1 Tfp pilus assembly protein PilF [Bosea sp. 127]